MNVLLSTLNAKYIHTSLALRYLQAYGRSKGSTYDIEEYTINMPIYHILRDITAKQYDIIGFSCYIWNIEMTLHLVTLIKLVAPHTEIILGGPEVSYVADEVLLNNPSVSYIVQGEGEEVFTALMKALKTGENWTEIPGIRGRDNEGALIGSTEVVEVQDLSTIPFPYTVEDLKKIEHKIVYFESSRGCPFSCQYCLSGNRNTVRFFPQERTLQELQWFMEHKVQQVKFVDRTFNCSPKHHLPIMNFIKNADTDTNFHVEIEAGLLQQAEVDILTSAPAKRFQIEVGVQSTFEKTLLAVARRNDWAHIQKTIQPIIDSGRTHVHMDLIVGLPYETAARFSQSFNDLFSMAPQALQIGFLKLLKGSGLRAKKEYCYQSDPQAPYEVLANHVMTYEEVRFLKIFEDVFETYYNSEKYIQTFRYLQELFSKKTISPYHCFAFLTERWQEAGNHTISLRDKDKAQFLYAAIALLAEAGFITVLEATVLKDLLRIDILIAFGGKIKTTDLFLPVQDKDTLKDSEAFWKDEVLVRKWIPDFTFQEWRRIRQDFYELPIDTMTAEYLKVSGTQLIVDVTGKVPLFARPELSNEKI